MGVFNASEKRNVVAQTADEAQYNIARPCLVYGDFGLEQVREESLGDPAIVAMMDKLTFAVDEDMDAQFSSRRICKAEIITQDGRVFLFDECEPRGETKALEMIATEADMPIRALVDEVNKAEYMK